MLLTEGIDEKKGKRGYIKKRIFLETAREQFINIIEKDEKKVRFYCHARYHFQVFFMCIFFLGELFSPRSIFCAKRFELR